MTTVRGNHDEATLAQMAKVAEDATYTALMADGHVGYYMPIGGVAAYPDHLVSPHGVGVDIACGNAAVRTDLTIESSIMKHLGEVADEIAREIGFGVGQPTNPSGPVDHPLFDSARWDVIPSAVRGNLKGRARAQLGTVGGGNHYVDVFADEEGRIWIGVHFGSRGLGYLGSNGMILQAQGGTWNNLNPRADWNSPVRLNLHSPIGHDYWELMQLAGEFAYAGRDWVVDKVAEIIGASEIHDEVHNHHNFAWLEEHHDQGLVVVRKGATPAFPDQRGFVGGSMGDISVILRGAYTQDEDTRDAQIANLFSTVHGAGRVMGRRAAAGKWKKGRMVKEGRVTPEMMLEATGGLIRRGGDLDEAPQVYRPLREVLEAQGSTIVVEEVLHPLIVCMAPGRTGAVR